MILLWCLVITEARNFYQWNLSNNTADISLSSCDGKIGPIPGTVPGIVHTDLISAGIIKLNPLFRYEEENLSWITEKCWAYTIRPTMPDDLNFNSDLYLRFEGIDTVSTICFNDIIIGESSNAFRSYTFQVSKSLLNKGPRNNVIRIEISSARLYAKSQASEYPYIVPETQNYNVWAEPTSRNFIRKAGSDMGWDWGPAYIPSGITGDMFFFQQDSVLGAGRLDGFVVHQEIAEDYKSARMKVVVYITDIPVLDLTDLQHNSKLEVSTIAVTDVMIDLKVNNIVVGSKKVQISHLPGASAVQEVTLDTVSLEDLQLWWPVGVSPDGKPYLYTVEVVYNEDQAVVRKVGFRTVELVQDPVPTTTTSTSATAATPTGTPTPASTNPHLKDLYTVAPTSFYFKINGVAVFMRGANFIPIDVFQSRVTDTDRAYILHTAMKSNMNMIRVWGGGIYQPNQFYETADELGIMIWQEVMLACALYPTNDAFLQEISIEVRQQALRLGTHASIVIWGGNNENEVALGWFPESLQNRDLYVSDYSKLYGDTVYPALKAVLGVDLVPSAVGTGKYELSGWNILYLLYCVCIFLYLPFFHILINFILLLIVVVAVAWVDSSPSNGLISASSPYAKRWGAASTPSAGDVHFYDYSCNCEDPVSYPEARFISEFGFQTMPSFLTYKPVSVLPDWNASSPLMQYRQRHEDGNAQIEAQLTRHFALPHSCASPSDITSGRSFDMYLYLVTLQQSRCYETAVNKWRQIRGIPTVPTPTSGYTMGILYWQLNDIWQGPSWASMEYGGRWKPLQYSIQRAYAPIVVTTAVNFTTTDSSSSSEGVAQKVTVHAVSDLATYPAATLSVTLQLLHWERSHEAYTVWSSDNIILHGGNSAQLTEVAISSALLKSAGCTVNTCYMRTTSTITHPSGETPTVLYPSLALLAPIKDAVLPPAPVFTISKVVQVHNKEVRFELSTSATSPFSFLELNNIDAKKPVDAQKTGVFGASAGWFSDNNFLAEKGQVYTLTYTSYSVDLSVEVFIEQLQVRALQHAYDCSLSLSPTFSA